MQRLAQEEAELAAQLTPSLETVEEIAARTGSDVEGVRNQLKAMSRRGLIAAGKKESALGFRLMPFVVEGLKHPLRVLYGKRSRRL